MQSVGIYLKVLAVIVSLTACGAGLLCLRQQRFETMHEMTLLHRRINQNRRDLWQWQTRIARRTSPEALAEALMRCDLPLEPVTKQARPTPLASSNRHDALSQTLQREP